MKTNKNECYNIIKFIFGIFTWMYLKTLIKSKKYNFIQNGLHCIRLLSPISCKLLLMWHIAVLVKFHSMLNVVSAVSHQQCDKFFTGLAFKDKPHRKIHGIKIWGAWRPHFFGPKIWNMVSTPILGNVCSV